jgi:Fic family protein
VTVKEMIMRGFQYADEARALYTPEIVGMLTSLHEYKGRQQLFIEANADSLETLLEIAKIQSTGASNRIEGIGTTDKRLNELVRQKSAPRSRPEQEIAGYRDVLAAIHESYAYIEPRPNIILQLHRQLYSFSESSFGGSYKSVDNRITEIDAKGNEFLRFDTVPAYLTADAMERLCAAMGEGTDKREHDPLLLIPMFIMDFLCIHPFLDGNGRMSRLLTLLLLYRAGYICGKYISIEKLIESSKEVYYNALQSASEGWHANKNDYQPFVRYSLGVLLKAHREFEERTEFLRAPSNGASKPDRVKALIDRKPGTITKKEILEACPDISKITIERTLASLVKTGYLVKSGAARSVVYGKNSAKKP